MDRFEQFERFVRDHLQIPIPTEKLVLQLDLKIKQIEFGLPHHPLMAAACIHPDTKTLFEQKAPDTFTPRYVLSQQAVWPMFDPELTFSRLHEIGHYLHPGNMGHRARDDFAPGPRDINSAEDYVRFLLAERDYAKYWHENEFPANQFAFQVWFPDFIFKHFASERDLYGVADFFRAHPLQVFWKTMRTVTRDCYGFIFYESNPLYPGFFVQKTTKYKHDKLLLVIEGWQENTRPTTTYLIDREGRPMLVLADHIMSDFQLENLLSSKIAHHVMDIFQNLKAFAQEPRGNLFYRGHFLKVDFLRRVRRQLSHVIAIYPVFNICVHGEAAVVVLAFEDLRGSIHKLWLEEAKNKKWHCLFPFRKSQESQNRLRIGRGEIARWMNEIRSLLSLPMKAYSKAELGDKQFLLQ